MKKRQLPQVSIDAPSSSEGPFSERDASEQSLLRNNVSFEDRLVERDSIARLLSFLNDRDRMIIDLYFFQSVKGCEIAEQLHWSPNQLQTRLQKIYRQLKMLIQERMDDPEWSSKYAKHSSSTS